MEQTKERYTLVVDVLRREFGMQRLSDAAHGPLEELHDFVLSEATEVPRVLDVLEVVLRIGLYSMKQLHHRLNPESFHKTVNEIFRRHALGYQLEGHEIVRVDNTFVHAEVTKPALELLADPRWRGPNEEFRKAHEHYRHGDNKEAITEAAKSFESVLKSICSARKWTTDPNATSKMLLDVCFQHDLVPAFWQTQMSALRSLLESSVPTGRNKRGAHGQGPEPVRVPDELAGYVLHMAAAAIVFLVKADGTAR